MPEFRNAGKNYENVELISTHLTAPPPPARLKASKLPLLPQARPYVELNVIGPG
jgi:hypothetical protein